MRRRLIWTLVALLVNLALLPLVVATSRRAAAGSNTNGIFFPCCEETPGGAGYCCDGCCIFTWNCSDQQTCRKR